METLDFTSRLYGKDHFRHSIDDFFVPNCHSTGYDIVLAEAE